MPQLSVLPQTISQTWISRSQHNSLHLKKNIIFEIFNKKKITNRCFPHNFFLLHRRSQQKGFFIGSYCIASIQDVDLLDCPQRH
jgi:hypothetical protein